MLWYEDDSPHLVLDLHAPMEQARLVKTVKVHIGLANSYGSDRRLPHQVTGEGDRYRLGHQPVVSLYRDGSMYSQAMVRGRV